MQFLCECDCFEYCPLGCQLVIIVSYSLAIIIALSLLMPLLFGAASILTLLTVHLYLYFKTILYFCIPTIHFYKQYLLHVC